MYLSFISYVCSFLCAGHKGKLNAILTACFLRVSVSLCNVHLCLCAFFLCFCIFVRVCLNVCVSVCVNVQGNGENEMPGA